MIGLHKNMIALHKNMIGLYKNIIGLHKNVIGLHKNMIGLHKSKVIRRCMCIDFSLFICIRFVDAVIPILQDGRYKPEKAISSRLLVFALQTIQRMIPYLEDPGKIVMENLQDNIIGVGCVMESDVMDEEVIHSILVLWSKWGKQKLEDPVIRSLAVILSHMLRAEPLSRISTIGKFIRSIVCNLFTHLEKKELLILESAGVHRSLRTLLLHYGSFSVEGYQLVVLGCGSMEDIVNRSSNYLEEGIPDMLLFAAQEFAGKGAVLQADDKGNLQWSIWTLLSLLCRQNNEISTSLYAAGVLDVVKVVILSSPIDKESLFHFLTSFVKGNSVIKKDLLENPDILIEINKTLRESIEQEPNIIQILSAGDFFVALTGESPGIKEISALIIQQNILQPLMEASKKYPEFLAEKALHCIRSLCVVGSSRDSSNRRELPGAQWSMNKIEEELKNLGNPTTIYEATYNHGYHKILEGFLEINLASVAKATLVFQVLTTFFYHCPLKVSHIICTEDLLRHVSQAAEKHTESNESQHLQATIANFISSITYNCLTFADSTKRLQSAKVHEAVLSCFKHVHTESVMLRWVKTFSNLVYCYKSHLKDFKCLFECKAQHALLQVAEQYGSSHKIAEELDRCLLNWTFDKESSERLSREGYTELLIPFANKEYCTSLRRTALQVIGNIAISGQKVKQVLVEKKLHLVLLSSIRELMHDKSNVPFLAASCRLLHIMASPDTTKVLLLEANCMQLMMEIVETFSGVLELEWRPLGVISSMCFIPVACRHHILKQELSAFLSYILHNSNQSRVIGYAALVMIAMAEDDQGLLEVAKLYPENILQTAIENPSYILSFSDITRWANIVIEKILLHTIKLSPSVIDFEIPPVPDFGSGCQALLPNCEGRIRVTGGKWNGCSPASPNISQDGAKQLVALGRNPNDIFRVGRMYGSSHGLCSNCEKDGPSSELVFRPHSLSPAHYQELINQGWYRRGGVKMFRFHRVHKMDCCDWETRVLVSRFSNKSHKSFKKVLKKMPKEIQVTRHKTYFNKDAFDLYNDYHVERYDKPVKSEHSYVEHVVNTPLAQQKEGDTVYGTFHDEYRLGGKLVAVSVLDIVPRGMVSIYMWYDLRKEISKYSFGVYSALKEIEDVQNRSSQDENVEHYYLQGWNALNRRLKYKGDYEPEEFYAPSVTDHWVEGKEGVEKEKASVLEALQKTEPMETDSASTDGQPTQNDLNKDGQPTASASSTKKGSAEADQFSPASLEKDRAVFQCHYGTLNVNDIVVCLNHQMYMTFGDLKVRLPISVFQKKLMDSRFEELMLAVGGTLASQMVIDLIMIPI